MVELEKRIINIMAMAAKKWIYCDEMGYNTPDLNKIILKLKINADHISAFDRDYGIINESIKKINEVEESVQI